MPARLRHGHREQKIRRQFVKRRVSAIFLRQYRRGGRTSPIDAQCRIVKGEATLALARTIVGDLVEHLRFGFECTIAMGEAEGLPCVPFDNCPARLGRSCDISTPQAWTRRGLGFDGLEVAWHGGTQDAMLLLEGESAGSVWDEGLSTARVCVLRYACGFRRCGAALQPAAMRLHRPAREEPLRSSLPAEGGGR